ncbi:MAG TPA: hypothetical protein DIC34_13385 [Treponema sp.]|nr:MAG: hypothetical protein A2001_03980 [Treponema sp. GWC1_61_84]OHE75596.1 MAG: hypothetical protein A2413_10960 [Treponema sp. RIFOXYC1_FULL_61_9]HCM27516.1 hypothetical protein [Treponema sp.]
MDIRRFSNVFPLVLVFALAFVSCAEKSRIEEFKLTSFGWVIENIPADYYTGSTFRSARLNVWLKYEGTIDASDIKSARVYLPDSESYWTLHPENGELNVNNRVLGGWTRWYLTENNHAIPIGTMRAVVELTDGTVSSISRLIPAPGSLETGAAVTTHTENSILHATGSAPLVKRAAVVGGSIAVSAGTLSVDFSVNDDLVYNGFLWLYNASDEYIGHSRYFRDAASGAFDADMFAADPVFNGNSIRIALRDSAVTADDTVYMEEGMPFADIAKFRIVLMDGAQYGLSADGRVMYDCRSLSELSVFEAP